MPARKSKNGWDQPHWSKSTTARKSGTKPKAIKVKRNKNATSDTSTKKPTTRKPRKPAGISKKEKATFTRLMKAKVAADRKSAAKATIRVKRNKNASSNTNSKKRTVKLSASAQATKAAHKKSMAKLGRITRKRPRKK